MDPLVSIIITTYNLEWCVEEALRSALGQTYGRTEVIVVDDASTDDTIARVAPYLGRVRLIRHEKNQGPEGAAARNTGIRAAKGELIAFLDGDDLWEEGKIAVQVQAAREFPEAGLIVTDGCVFAHSDGRILRTTLLNHFGDAVDSVFPQGSAREVDLYSDFLRGCLFDTPSQVMVRAEALKAVGAFRRVPADDYDFYLRLFARFRGVVLRKALVRYRYHAANVSGRIDRQFFRWAQPNISIWREHLKQCRPGSAVVIRQQMKELREAVAERALAAGQNGERAWALRFLTGFLLKNAGTPGSGRIAIAVARLAIPGRLRATLRKVRRQA
jgi:glycosyltransferase involved in cell wall biosynthesis